MKQSSICILSFLCVTFGCAPRAADTSTAAPEPDPAEAEASSQAAQPDVPSPDILQANQQDIEALKTKTANVEEETRVQIQMIDEAQKALEQLATFGSNAGMKEDRLNTIIGAAAQKGEMKGAKKFSKADRDAAKEQLQKLHEVAPKLRDASERLRDAITRVEKERAEGQALLETIQGRSNAVTAAPEEDIHPDLMAQVNEARQSFATLEGTYEASKQILDEAMTRARSLSEALGVDSTGPTAESADITEAPGMDQPQKASGQ